MPRVAIAIARAWRGLRHHVAAFRPGHGDRQHLTPSFALASLASMSDARWSSLRAIVAKLSTAANRDDFIEDCLTTVLDCLRADRVLAFLLDSAGGTVTLEARGPRGRLQASEQAEISRGVIHQVWRHNRTQRWEPLDPTATKSVTELGIVVAIAAPMRSLLAGDVVEAPRGVLYVDFRDPATTAGEPEVELIEIVASMLAVVIERNEVAARATEELRVRDAREGRRLPPPSLDEILRYPSFAPLRAELATAVVSELPLLLLGESGVGKTLVARAIAETSGKLPMVRAMLGAAEDLNTITSELFGHERGSYSGALNARTGLVEFAEGGTLILDEILNLPLHAQKLLLDFTQFGTYRPLGHSAAEPRIARTRLITATNGDVDRAVRSGEFREDLMHRLSGLVVTLPPLRERRDEIPELAEAFLRRLDPDRGWRLTPNARRRLLAKEQLWPGNLRQLELVTQRARDRALAHDRDTDAIDVAQLDGHEVVSTTRTAAGAPARWQAILDERERLDDLERELLTSTLSRHHGVVARAAQELGIGRTSFASRMQTLKAK